MPRVPAPWRLRGQAHALMAWLPRSAGASHRLGVLGFLRYVDSDVGPYDELLWLAPWGISVGGRRFHTVERIFVSSRSSRDNGRANWGIPKELARFDVRRLDASTQRAQVWAEGRLLASFVIETGARSLEVDWAALPERMRSLGQVLDARSFVVKPSLQGSLHGARFSELAGEGQGFVQLAGARAIAACSLLDFEMIFPEADSRPTR